MQRFGALVVVVVSVGVAGQEPGREPARLADCSGKTTLDGLLLSEGKVGFHPEKGKAIFANVENGIFSLKAAPGKYRVTVESKRTALPKKYANPEFSGLAVEVKVNSFEISLRRS